MRAIVRIILQTLLMAIASLVLSLLRIVFPKIENSHRNRVKIALLIPSIVFWSLAITAHGAGRDVYFILAIIMTGAFLYSFYWARQIGKSLEDVFRDPHKDRFYKATQAAWSSGKLSNLGEQFESEGKKNYTEFIVPYLPIKGSELFIFLTGFPPREDEFLIGLGNPKSRSNKGWFVLTSQRLIQKDGRDKSFKEVILRDVDAFDATGTWTKTLLFKMKSGEAVKLEKVDIYPSEKFLAEAIMQAKTLQLTDSEKVSDKSGDVE